MKSITRYAAGLAMAIHARARATIDIDMLILSESLEKVLPIALELGYKREIK